MTCTSCHNPHGSTNVRMLRRRQLDQRDLHQLPRREARPVPVGSRAGPRGLQHAATTRTARTTTGCSSRSCRCSASAATSARGTRRRFTTRTQLAAQEQPADRPRLRQLPRADPRVEQPGRQHVPSLRRHDMRITSSVHPSLLLPLAALSAAAERPGEHAATRAGLRTPAIADGGQHRAGRLRLPRHGATATTRTRRGISAIGTCATARSSKGSAGARTTITAFWDVRATHVGYRDQQYSAELQQLRQGEGVVRVQPDPAVLQPGTRGRCTRRRRRASSVSDGYPAQVQSGAATSRDLRRERAPRSTCG